MPFAYTECNFAADFRHGERAAAERLQQTLHLRVICAEQLLRIVLPAERIAGERFIEFSYKNDELGDPLMNAYHAIALKAATREEIETIKAMAFKVNEVMKQYFDTLNVILVDFKLEFGKTADGKIVLADEISPDTCRLWDKTTKEKLDKDRFRRDMGGVEEAYQEIMKRVMGK